MKNIWTKEKPDFDEIGEYWFLTYCTIADTVCVWQVIVELYKGDETCIESENCDCYRLSLLKDGEVWGDLKEDLEADYYMVLEMPK